MSLPTTIANRLTLPIVCAPMFLISGPDLVVAARTAGFMGAFPRQNVRTRAEFDGWLADIEDRSLAGEAQTGRPAGPLAVNIPTTLEPDEIAADMDVCARRGVQVIITSVGKPDVATALAHERGLLVHHDATSVRFAEKAISAGVDGLNCIGAGGGGHAGTVSHLALIPRIRAMFDGTISLAGAVSTGAAVRAAEILGADLAFMGTRFTATVESLADPQQKAWIVEDDATRVRYTRNVNGVPASWMLSSLEARGIDIDALTAPDGRGHDHLPEDLRPWRDLWSAGHGIELIDDVPTVAELAARLTTEYLAACAVGDRSAASRS